MGIKAKVISGLKWEATAKLAGQLVTWGFTILVMRLLEPKDYGLMAMAMLFVSFLHLFKEMGMGAAIVQKKDIDAEILRRIFGAAIILNSTLFLLLFLSSPIIADFFGESRLTNLIRILSIQFLIIPFEIIPYSLLLKKMQYRGKSLVELGAAVSGGSTALLFAYLGFGIWALVAGTILQTLVRVAGLNVISPYLEKPCFSLKGLRNVLSFGGLVTIEQTLWFLYSQADVFIIGKLLGSKLLGFYSVSMHLASLPMQKINSVLNQVAFPAFSHIQGNQELVTNYLAKSLRLVNMFSFPVFFGIAVIAEEAVLVLLGEKWRAAILPMTILSVIMPIRMASNLFPTVARGVGRPDINVINLIIASVIMPAAFVIGSHWGLLGVSLAWLIAYPVVFCIEVQRTKTVTNIGIKNVAGTMLKPATASLFMVIAVLITKMMLPDAGKLALLGIEIGVGASVFCLALWLIYRDGVRETIELIKPETT